jgi:hypothetical protein
MVGRCPKISAHGPLYATPNIYESGDQHGNRTVRQDILVHPRLVIHYHIDLRHLASADIKPNENHATYAPTATKARRCLPGEDQGPVLLPRHDVVSVPYSKCRRTLQVSVRARAQCI